MNLKKKISLLTVVILMLLTLSPELFAQVATDSSKSIVKSGSVLQDSTGHKRRKKKPKASDSVSVDSTITKTMGKGTDYQSTMVKDTVIHHRKKKQASTVANSDSSQNKPDNKAAARKKKKDSELKKDSLQAHSDYSNAKPDTATKKKTVSRRKKQQLTTAQYDSIAMAQIHKQLEEKKDTVIQRVLTPEDMASDVMNSGFLNLRGGHYDQAILYFNKVIVSYSTTTQANPALFYRAKCYLGLKDTGLAITDISLFIDRDKCKSSFCSEAYFLRANVYFNTRDYKHAIGDFSKVATDTAFKNQKFCFFYRAICEGEIDQNIQAVQDFTRFLNIDNNKTANSAEALYYRGYYKVKLNDNRGAIKDYDNAIALYLAAMESSKGRENVYLSKLIDTYITRGLAKAEIKKFDEAVADYNSVIKLNPDYAVAYRLKGLAEIGKGDTDAGCLDLSKAGELGSMEAYDDIKLHCK